MALKFIAAVLDRNNAPLEIDELEVPGLGVGQVLVRLACSGVCGAQLGEQAGVKGPNVYGRHTLGHEGAGTVLDVGPGVRHVGVGDHVCCHWRKGIGIDAEPPKYRRTDGRGIVGGGAITTFQELAVISENRLTRVPKDIPAEHVALFGCALTTALGILNNDAQLKFGQSIAVLGCGGVGQCVIQAAAMASADPIYGIDLYEAKRQLALDFGATAAFPSADLVREFMPGGVDVFVETTGRVECIEQAYELTAPTGKTVLVGQMHWSQRASIQTLPMHAGKVLFASEGGQTNPTIDIPRYMRLYRSGKLRVDELITHRFPLTSVNEAMDRIRAGEVGRCILTMSDADAV